MYQVFRTAKDGKMYEKQYETAEQVKRYLNSRFCKVEDNKGISVTKSIDDERCQEVFTMYLGKIYLNCFADEHEEEAHKQTEVHVGEDSPKSQRIKWINHNVNLKRGVHAPVMVKLNNSDKWFEMAACGTTQTAKASAKALAKYVGATQVEMKLMWLDGKPQFDEKPIKYLILNNDGEVVIKFRIEHEVPEGAKRKFTYFQQSELFHDGIENETKPKAKEEAHEQTEQADHEVSSHDVIEIADLVIGHDDGGYYIGSDKTYRSICQVMSELADRLPHGKCRLEGKEIIIKFFDTASHAKSYKIRGHDTHQTFNILRKIKKAVEGY